MIKNYLLKFSWIFILFGCNSNQNESGFMKMGNPEYKLIILETKKYPSEIDTVISQLEQKNDHFIFTNKVLLEYLKPLDETSENKDTMYSVLIKLDHSKCKLRFNQYGGWMNRDNWKQTNW